MAKTGTTLVRVIFRGLMLFTFKKKLPGNYDVDNPPGNPPDLGEMKVFLVNDIQAPGTVAQKLKHGHPPQLRWYGAGQPGNKPTVALGDITGRRVTIDWASAAGSQPNGVRVEPSFVRYVPRLSSFLGATAFKLTSDKARLNRYVASEIVIPRGKVFAERFVRWPPEHRREAAPAEVEMVTMLNNVPSGLMASEVTVELEIANTPGRQVNLDYETLKLGKKGPLKKLKPFTTTALKQIVDPNAIEILVTSFSPQREVAVPWSVHFQWLFQLHDTPAHAQNTFTRAKLDSFRNKLSADEQAQWVDDLNLLGPGANGGVGYPFPIVQDPHTIPPTLPFFRSPEYRPICPPGWGDDE